MKRIFFISLFLFSSQLLGQACCTAGTPLLSSLETSNIAYNNLQIGLSYRYNSISDLYSGDFLLDDKNRRRFAQSVIIQIDYGIWKNLSLSALLSFVHQERIIITPLGDENTLRTQGAGDALFLLKYNIVPLNILDEMEISAGGGVKIPIGKSQIKSNGLLIPPDMQPGTGSWDFLIWLYFSKGRLFGLPLTAILNFSFRINGNNNRFNVENFDYKFGNELVTQLGFAYRTDFISDFSLFLRYRNTGADISSDFDIPNTGGEWINLVPGINFKIDKTKTIRVSGEIPIYVKLNGTQLTTSFTTNLALYYLINI